MITGAIKNQVDIIRYAFRSGGISKPLEGQGHERSFNRHKEVVHEAAEF